MNGQVKIAVSVAVVIAGSLLATAATKTTASKTTVAKTAAPPSQSTGWAARAEQMAAALFPEEKLNHIQGFFGPVTKKYLPVFQRFSAEYQTSTDKMALIARYLPQAEKALAEAKQMKVPAKYEAEKAGYINKAETLLTAIRFSLQLTQAQGS